MYDSAITNFEKVISLNPDITNAYVAHNGLGMIYADRKEYDLALMHFKKVVTLNLDQDIDFSMVRKHNLLKVQDKEA